MEDNEAYQRLRKRVAQGSQTQNLQQHQQRQGEVLLQKYNGRRYTADELNQAVKRAYQAVDKAYSDIRTLFVYFFASFRTLTTTTYYHFLTAQGAKDVQ